ncbi:MAG: c-type cytochrome [Planctomycetales bacterium]
MTVLCRWFTVWISAWGVWGCTAIPLSAEERTDEREEVDDEELSPGLVARYVAGDRQIERIDRALAWTWDDSVPDQRLPAGPFSARWIGRILISSEGKHAFHLYLQGRASVRLDGQEVARGVAENPGWIAGEELTIEGGEHALEVEYARTGEGAVLRLFWAGESFPIEPVPPHILFHTPVRPNLAWIERGGELFAAHRCNRCHRRMNEALSPPLADLVHAASGISPAWLSEWLRDPTRMAPHPRMPNFGFTAEEAEAAAAFLASQARPVQEQAPTVADRKERHRRGEVLFRSIGCLACHPHGELGHDRGLGGGDLTQVGRKRSAPWLDGWLKDPASLNPDHRMPVFKLSDDERRDLAIYLAGLEPSAQPEKQKGLPDQGLIARGRTLVERARCGVCHGLAAETIVTGVSGLDQARADWSKSCSEAPPDRKRNRPGFEFTPAERQALRAFVESRSGTLSQEGGPQAAQRLLMQNNCLQCHDRNGQGEMARVAKRAAATDPDLTGQTEALQPPDLSAVGDKLHDEFLTKGVAGEQPKIRLPWLRVRMPRFSHTPGDRALLVQSLIDQDRIPPDAPRNSWMMDNQPVEVSNPDQQRQAGRVLAGTRGFSCVACHKVGSFEPRNVALASRGSDLFGLSQRMREPFFQRWVRAPLRVIPNMEMPSFDKPLPDLLDGRHAAQMAALWSALNDPQGPPALDTSLIEQELVVTPGAPAKIIRDVFNVGDMTSPRFVPRSLAVGFHNGFHALFDLDAMAWHGSWTGDFARQRASGKSWFWEPAGAMLPLAAGDSPDVALRPQVPPDAPLLRARRDGGRFGRLLDYQGEQLGVRLRYQLAFDLELGGTEILVAETWSVQDPGPNPRQMGLQRHLAISGLPAGFDAIVQTFNDQGNRVERPLSKGPAEGTAEGDVAYTAIANNRTSPQRPANSSKRPVSTAEPVTAVPGYDGVRLPLPWSIMPTALTWTSDGTLAFCSLKGQVYLARDTDGDGIVETLILFEEGLAAPYGLIADGDSLIVAHKPELLRLRDTDGDGRADRREVLADGWGFTDDYHDWTTGIVRDSHGNLFIGTGSDYAKSGRPAEKARWRGKVLRVSPSGQVEAVGHAFRYPTGLAITPDDQVFVSDNQGVQNPFNEINHLIAGAHYGVPSLHEEPHDTPPRGPAIRVPHPWTRSVNGIFFLPSASGPQRAAREQDGGRGGGREIPTTMASPFAGHGIGCEYDSRFLVRFSLQRVGETFQGAVYPFSHPPGNEKSGQLLGTLCGGVAPNGDIYIGSFLDSGWLGGPNVGDLVRLRPNSQAPLGIREIQAFADEFVVSFTAPVDPVAASLPVRYNIAGYTRVWQGGYATPDSGRHNLAIRSVEVAPDRRSVVLHTDRQHAGHIYEITCGRIGPDPKIPLWPSVGHYTMNVVP